MGILSRAIRLCKADLHGVMDQMENRELLFKQHLREMQTAIAGRQARIDQLEDTGKALQRDLRGYTRQISRLEEDLDQAIAKDKDAIARMLIRKLHPMRQSAQAMERRSIALTDELALERDHCAAQIQAYEEVRQRVAAARKDLHHPESRLSMPPGLDGTGHNDPTDEEIEWELFQRKEALASGRSR